MKTKIYLLILIIFLFISEVLNAQYYFFGRNKVQYNEFNWKILKTEHFDIYYYDDFGELAEIGANFAEKAYNDYKVQFNNVVINRIPLIFYNTHIHFQQTNITPYFIPEGVGGFFEFIKGRVVIPYMGSISQFEHVIRHELVHVFMTNKIFRILSNHRIPADKLPPLWFVEGLAEYLSTEWDSQAEMVMRDALINNIFVGVQNMYQIYGTFLMYKEGQSFLEFIKENYGHHKVLQMIDNFWMYDKFDDVIEYTIGKSIIELDKEWLYSLRKKYFPLFQNYIPISDASEIVTKQGFNFSPVYYKSNQEEYIYYLANINGYSSLYRIKLSDNENKKIKPELLIEGEKTDQFEAFHLLIPSLAISNNGIVAFITKKGATDAIHFYSIEEKKIINTFQKDYLISLSSPSFNNDGTKLLFQSIDNKGYSDIYLLDINNNEEIRLTNDYFDDKNPIFGIKDNQIIFSSDRTEDKQQKIYNLFELNSETLSINYITNLKFNTTEPQISKDGGKLIFSSEIDGIKNVWSMNINNSSSNTMDYYFSDTINRVTNFYTSVFNPFFIDKNKILFAGFEKFYFKIYNYELKKDTTIEQSIVMNFNDEKEPWAANRIVIPSEEHKLAYRKQYTLDYAAGQVSTDPLFGTYGGAVLSLSDLLGDDNFFLLLYNTAEVQSDILNSFNVSITRINLKKRANYGYGIFHFRGRRYDLRESDDYYFERSFGGNFLMNFPISKFERIETSLTIANSDKEIFEGFLERKALLWSNSVSYVLDNSIWSSSGPIDGKRIRLLLGYTTDVKYSNVNYFSFIADYREYVRISLRSALAFRAAIFYNEGKEARRYFMGGSWDLHGWPRWSIRGQKMWLSSLEFRFPLIDQIYLRFPFGSISFFGLRAATFFDIGSAWDNKYEETLGSVGFGIRFNLFNAIVLRYDIGKKIEDNFSKFQNKLFYQFFFGWDF